MKTLMNISTNIPALDDRDPRFPPDDEELYPLGYVNLG